MGSGSVAYLAGTFVCRRWIVRHGMGGAVKRAGGFTLAGGALLVLAALLGWLNLWAVLLPQWLFCFGHGVHQPCGQAGAVGPFPQAAGAASALAGFVLAATAFGVGLWLGQALDGRLLPFALGLGFWALLTSLTAWTLVQRLAR
jgi:DHA1 family bicyclomycin/chloramphenicol resistance-like MFS transporter